MIISGLFSTMHSIIVVVVLFGMANGAPGGMQEMKPEEIFKDKDLLAGLDMAVEQFNAVHAHANR